MKLFDRVKVASEQRREPSVVETPASVVETAATKRPRTADRHKDPKAHSAKTAARARAKRAAK